MPKRIININFEELRQVLRNGVRRSIIFMGFGLNSPAIRPRIPYTTKPEDFEIHLVPHSVDEKNHDYLLDEYSKWVTLNGLRDLTESFSTFISSLYTVIFTIKWHKNRSILPSMKSPDRIEKLGLSDQISELSKFIEVDSRLPSMISSLNQARNCLAHRHGVIGAPDVDPRTKIYALSWLMWKPIVIRKNGEIYEPTSVRGLRLESGESLGLRLLENRKVFSIGDRLNIEHRELKEIGLSLTFFGTQFIKSAEILAVHSGIPVSPAQKNDNPSRDAPEEKV